METKAKYKLKLDILVKTANVAKLLSGEELKEIGTDVVENYRADIASRKDWEERSQKAIELALQVQRKRTFPWANASNVKFPLLTIAALQFLARVSIMTKGKHIVKVEVLGRDSSGEKGAQAKRVSTHMSLQLTTEDSNWMDSDEQAKLSTAILGSGFKKSYHDTVLGVNISEFVPAMNFVLDYYTKDPDKANRATHLIPMNANMVQERVRRGVFLPIDPHAPSITQEPNQLRDAADDNEGIQRPNDGEFLEYDILEQHTWVDFDGDGYAEPYIISVRRDTGQVLRIVARFTDVDDVHRVNDSLVKKLEQASYSEEDLKKKGELEREAHRLHIAANNHIIRIDPTLYFTRYLFIPSPDGGVYGLGLGALLGPMNESVNTLVNQLIDAGTMANTAGGFLGRGVKLKGGKSSFDPFEWKPVDSTGNDLRQNIFPLPVREPSGVLFQLLGMLIEYSEKISGATDIMSGISPGQNTPAETSRNTVEQGMMLFSGIYTRMHRAFTAELRKLHRLNQLFIEDSPRFYELSTGADALLAKGDYTNNSFRIAPSVGAESVSQSQRREKALMVYQLAGGAPGFDRYKVTVNLLEAHDVDDIDGIFPDPAGPKAIAPPVNPKIELEKEKLAQNKQEHQDNMALAIAGLKNELQLTEAKIAELHAKASKELSEAQGVETGHQIALMEMQLAEQKHKRDGILSSLGVLNKFAETKLKHNAQLQGAKPTGEIDNGNNDAG